MDHETEVMKQNIADTREALSEKIDCLEQKVLRTVEGTTDIVANTAESVAEAVQGTVQKVTGAVDHAMEKAKESLDLRKQVEAHPWPMFGGSIVAGFIGGCLLTRSQSHAPMPEPRRSSQSYEPTRPRSSEWQSFSSAEQDRLAQRPSLFAPAMHRLRDLAIAATSKLVNDLLVSAAPPELHEDIRSTVGSFASALRGEPQPESASTGRPSEAPCDSESIGPRNEQRPFNRMTAAKGDGGNGRH
jgi:ElaB/YqjD/DUF883 family membrane-anchored ribosome-binding protein